MCALYLRTNNFSVRNERSRCAGKCTRTAHHCQYLSISKHVSIADVELVAATPQARAACTGGVLILCHFRGGERVGGYDAGTQRLRMSVKGVLIPSFCKLGISPKQWFRALQPDIFKVCGEEKRHVDSLGPCSSKDCHV